LKVRVRLPEEAFLPMVTVTVACAELAPLSVAYDGEMLHVLLGPWPLQESETVPVKPLRGDNVIV
jgi:hypothetical protein